MADVPRKHLMGRFRTLQRNLAIDPTDPDNPQSSAAAKRRMLAELEDKLNLKERKYSV